MGDLIVYGSLGLIIILSHWGQKRAWLQKILLAGIILVTVGEVALGLLHLSGRVQFFSGELLVTRQQDNVLTLALILLPLFGLTFLRRQVRLWLPTADYDPDNFTHLIGTWIFYQMLAYMLVVSATGIWNQAVANLDNAQLLDKMGFDNMWNIVLQKSCEAGIAFLGVGFLTKLSWRASLQRLGLKWPSLRQILTAVGLVFVLFSVQILVGSFIYSLQPETVEQGNKFIEAMGKAMPVIVNPLITVVIFGFFTGLGEELIFRGWLQLIAGIPLTTLLFGMFHYQYGISLDLVQVLILSLVLGLVRRYQSTSSAIIVHGLYNALSLLAIFHLT